MFTQQCLIHKNTKEIINFLNEIGYTLYEGSDNFSKNVACSCKFNTYFTFDDDEYVFPNTIDCKKNKELFFAVAALRDDDISLNDKINEINKKYGTKIEFRR